MTRYIKKSYAVDAIQYLDNAEQVVQFTGGSLVKEEDERLYIQTDGCLIRACPTDYVARGSNGNCYSWKKHMFEDMFVEGR